MSTDPTVYDQRDTITSLPRPFPQIIKEALARHPLAAGSSVPVDPLEAKRQAESILGALTPAQQRAVGYIVERWWSQKMAGIETQKVAEMQQKLDWLVAEVGKLRGASGGSTQGPGPYEGMW